MLRKAFFCSVIIILLMELGVRAAGLVNVPLYDVDAEIGYIPKPDQDGYFRQTNYWVVNDKRMGCEKWDPNKNVDLLLLGDSLVFGGNSLSQTNKLGPMLEKAGGGSLTAWPASAGSWSAFNELVYLKRYAALLDDIEILVWIVNSEDFGKLSTWNQGASAYLPQRSPWSGLIFFWNKYLRSLVLSFFRQRELPSPGGQEQEIKPNLDAVRLEFERWKSLLRDYSSQQPLPPILFVVYPAKSELEKGYSGKFRTLASAFRQNTSEINYYLLDISEEGRWKPSLYRDSIHPSAEGNRVLADIIYKYLSKTAPFKEILNKPMPN